MGANGANPYSSTMLRTALFLSLLGLFLVCPSHALAFGDDDGPPISITSPDHAITFVYGSVSQHSLFWDKKNQLLVAHLVFVDLNGNGGSTDNDAHDFRLPGVTFDQAKGIFFATSAKGEVIPVARVKKSLFFKNIETLPNATVRIQRMHGNVQIVLEAIRPDDPAMHAPPPQTNTAPDGTHTVDLQSILH
jgi:hypothetical protein